MWRLQLFWIAWVFVLTADVIPMAAEGQSYEQSALRLDTNFGDVRIVRGVEGTVVGKIGVFRGADVAQIVAASPNAVEQGLHDALARDRDCAIAVSGRGVPAEWVALARRSREQQVTVAVHENGLATVLGGGWAAEVLSGPRLDESALSMLRERIVAAPRCGWCGTPVPGRSCVRCAPGLGT